MHTIAAFEKNVITFCLGPSIKKKNSVAGIAVLEGVHVPRASCNYVTLE